MNQLAIQAQNAGTQPSPAALLGFLRVEFVQGEPLRIPVDASWKASREQKPGWMNSTFNDSTWENAKEVALFGTAVWGSLGGVQLTLSPAKANPFFGHCKLATTLDFSRTPIYLEGTGIAPEAAARITINGKDAGGFIGAPFRLRVDSLLKPGENTFKIEPFAPASARLVLENLTP
jgi:hypothetical protein